MRTVGVKELKNRLSEYVRLVKKGETVLVTERGQTVAELNPPRAVSRPITPEEKWADLIRRGIVTPATRRGEPLPPRQEAIMTLEQLLKELDEDRADRDLP